MVTCDQQENISSSQKVLLEIFLQIRNLFEGMLNETVYEWVAA